MIETIQIRASSWSTLFDCPARWYAQFVEGIKSPYSGAAYLGTCLHASTAIYDASIMNDDGLTVDDAAGVFVDTLHNHETDIAWSEELTPKKAENIGLVLHTQYCLNISPSHQFIGVEIKCNDMILSVMDELNILLTGTIDRIRTTDDGKLGISDIKSGTRIIDTYGAVKTNGHHLQLGIYQILAENELKQEFKAPAEIIGLKTAMNNPSVGIGEIENVKNALFGLQSQKGLIEHAGMMLKTGTFPGNSRSSLCSKKYCPIYQTCLYR